MLELKKRLMEISSSVAAKYEERLVIALIG